MSRAVRAGRAFVEVGLRSNLDAGIRKIQVKMRAAGRTISSFGRSFAQIGGAAAIGLIPVISRFASFDDAVREVGAVSRATDSELAKLRETAKRLGATTSFTATQVAELMAELGRAGFSPDKINEMTGAVLNLARATKTEAAVASGIMAASIRQFELSASDATRVADVLTTTANSSFTTLEQLGQALEYAGPVAKDFNMSIEETAAVIGTLGNVGIQATNAGTAVRRLLTVTGADAERLKGIFGVSFVDSAGNARPLIDTLDDVNKATANIGTAARAAKFQEAFGLLGITGASAIGRAAGSAKDLHKELLAAAGAADKAAKTMDAGIGGFFRFMISALDGVGIALGEALQDNLNKIASVITSVAAKVQAFIESNRSLVNTLVFAAGIIGTIGVGLLALGGIVSVVTAALGAIGPIVSAIGAAFGVVSGILGTVGALITGALSPAILIGVAVVGVVGWLVKQAYDAASAAGVFSTAWSGIKKLFGELFGIVKTTAGGMLQLLSAGQYVDAAKLLWVGLKAAFWSGASVIYDTVGDLVYRLWDAFKGFFANVITGLWETVKALPSLIMKALSGGASIADAISEGLLGNITFGDRIRGQANLARQELDRATESLRRLNEEEDRAAKKRKALEDLKNRQDELSEKQDAAELISSGVPSPTVGQSDAENEIQSKIDSLKADIEQYKKLSDAEDLAAIAAKGATEEQLRMVAALQEQRREAKRTAEAEERRAERVSNSIRDAGDNLSEAGRRPLEIFRRQIEAISRAVSAGTLTREQGQQLATDVRGDRDARIQGEVDEGKRLEESLRTPFEKFTGENERIAKLLAAGAINKETARRARAANRESFEDATKPTSSGGEGRNSAAEFGSQTAKDTIRRSRGLTTTVAPQFAPIVQGARDQVAAIRQMPQRMAAAMAKQQKQIIDTSRLETLSERSAKANEAIKTAADKIVTNTANGSSTTTVRI